MATDNEIINTICEQTLRPSTLNALHACRTGHPWNVPGVDHWREAAFAVAQDRQVGSKASIWLAKKSAEWEKANGHSV